MGKAINNLIDEYIASKNRHDIKGIMAFYSDDIVGKLAGIWQIIG